MNWHQRLLPLASRILLYAAIVLLAAGCSADGLIGKNTNKNISDLNSTINKTDTILSRLIANSRDSVLNYIQNGTRKTTRDISMGILEGTIGYIDDPNNRKNLIDLIDSLIDHAVGHSRVQLIQLRDELINDHFIGQVSKLAHELMHQLIVQPGTDLLNVVLNPNTRRQLEALLQMPIAAVLNDRAIAQIGKLRDTLLGIGLKRNVAGLVDTALLVLNARLDTQLSPTIARLTDKIGKQGKTDVNGVLYVIIGGVVLIAIVIFVLQEIRVQKKKKMLYYVTREIENFRKTNSEANFQQLTGNIRETMLNQRMEGDLRKFLYEEGINKTT